VNEQAERDRLVFRDDSGHLWAVEFEDQKPLGVHCLKCEGTPEEYGTGAPGYYRECPQADREPSD
jgi:hypothetical protein